MTGDAGTDEGWRALSAALLESDALDGDPVAAAVLALALTGKAEDSHSAAKCLGIAHALVLRSLVGLEEAPALIDITEKHPRTQRSFYHPTATARRLHTSKLR